MEQLKLKAKRKVDWRKWQQYSAESLQMDNALACCECVKRGIYDCTCESDDYNKWLNDVTYVRKFTPPPVRPVLHNGAMAIDRFGLVRGPYLYEDWRHYSFYLLDYFHDIVEGKDKPEWHRLFFRHEDDFYGGVYSHFVEIHTLLSRKMAGNVTRHSALNDFHKGVDMYENLYPAGLIKPTNFRGQGQMFTLMVPHYQNCKEIWNINPRHLNFEKIKSKLFKRAIKLKKRVNKMKKFNKKFKHRTMFYLPKKYQNLKRWYPKTKHVPIFYNYKSKKLEWPFFETDSELENLHFDYIKDTIEKWLKTKSIYIMKKSDQIDLVTPLVMANLPTIHGPPPDPDKKARMCHDGAWEKEIEGFPIPCKMEDLTSVLPHIRPNDLLTKLDDKRGFHLVQMNKESRGLTAFKFQNQILTYRVVPFGCPKSPAAFQRANAVATAYGRFFGVRSNLYMDDRLCLDNTASLKNGVPQNCFLTSMLCVASGGFISLTKSDFEPKQIQEFLGLQLNTQACEISVPKRKWEKFVTIIQSVISAEKCTFEQLEQIRGKAVSFILCNPMTKLFIRQMNQEIADALTRKTWRNSMIINLRPELLKELREWIKLDFLQMKNSWWPINNKDHRPHKVSFTDSSLFAIGVKIQFDNKFYSYTEYFSERDQNIPICQKEAIAILRMLYKCEKVLANTILVHFCDNTNVVHAYNGLGTKNRPMNQLITKIYVKLREMNSTIKMYWCSTKLQLADQPSRIIDMNEEFIPWPRFEQLCIKIGAFPVIDLMATRENTKAPFYVSWGKTYKIPNDNFICVGCDFFAFQPKHFESKIMYIFPPKPLTARVATHIERFYKHCKLIFIFHCFGELPLGIEMLIQNGAKILEWDENKISIIPCERKLEFHNQHYAGKWNERSKVTYVLLLNL